MVTDIGGVEDLADRVEDAKRVAELEGTETEGEGVTPQNAGSVFSHLDLLNLRNYSESG